MSFLRFVAFFPAASAACWLVACGGTSGPAAEDSGIADSGIADSATDAPVPDAAVPVDAAADAAADAWSPDSGPGPSPDCTAFPELGPSCGPHTTSEGRRGCACVVEEEAALPACDDLDPEAPLAARFRRTGDDDDPRWIVGTYPDLGDADLPDVGPELWAEELGTTIVPIWDGLPARNGLLENCVDGYRWVIPAISPDRRMVAVGHVWKHCGDGDDTAASLFGCGDDEEAWIVRNLFASTTNPLVHWGDEGSRHPTLYFVAGGYYRVGISGPQMVSGAQGEEVRAVVLESIETIARDPAGAAALGDPDVSSNERDGEWADAYAVFLAPDPALSTDEPPCALFRVGVMLADLRQCLDDCGEETPYCCRTAVLDAVCPETAGGAPTNPTLSLDGRLVAWHRDLANLMLPSTVYLTHNPFENDLAGCVADEEADGHARPIDCMGVLATEEPWDDPGGFCPPIELCDSGADCTTCASIGSFEATRNELGFFEWPGADGASRQFLSFMRSGRALDLYEISLAGDALRSEDPIQIDFVAAGSGYRDWGTGFFRVRHSGTL